MKREKQKNRFQKGRKQAQIETRNLKLETIKNITATRDKQIEDAGDDPAASILYVCEQGEEPKTKRCAVYRGRELPKDASRSRMQGASRRGAYLGVCDPRGATEDKEMRSIFGQKAATRDKQNANARSEAPGSVLMVHDPSRATEDKVMRRLSWQRGLTLLEILLAITIMSLVIAAITPLFRSATKSWEKNSRLSPILQKGREAMNRMVRELQEAPNIRLDAALSSTSVQYKVAPIFIDDGNSGYEETGTGSWTQNSGTGQGGDNRTGNGGGGTALWRPQIIVPGDYEVYAFFGAGLDPSNYTISTAGGNFSTNVNQTSFASTWYRLQPNNNTQFEFSAGTTGYVSVNNSGAGVIADAVKLVYQGSSFKEFKFDSSNNVLQWGYNDGSENLFTLADYVDVSNSSLTYFKIDGSTASSAKDVALIKIKLTLFDPKGKVSPVTLYGEAAVRNDNLRNVVINEIFYDPPQRTISGVKSIDFEPTARVEEPAECNGTYPDVCYPDGNWTNENSASHSGGTARYYAASSRRVVFYFTGTGVNVVYRVSSGGNGLAEYILQKNSNDAVVLTGVMDQEMHQSTGTNAYQVSFPIAYDLPSDTYRLTIKPLATRSSQSGNNRVYVDAFDYWTSTDMGWSQGGDTFYDNFESGDGFATNYQYNVGGAGNAYGTTWSTMTVGGGSTCKWEEGWVDDGRKEKPSTNNRTKTPPETNSGSYWVTDLKNKDMPNNCDEAIVSPTFKLGSSPKMFFKHWWVFEKANNDNDCMGTVLPLTGNKDLCVDGGGLVQISTDGGVTWAQLFPEGQTLDYPRTGDGDECGPTHCTNGYPGTVANGSGSSLAAGTWVFGVKKDRRDGVTDLEKSWHHSYFDLTNNDDDPSDANPATSYANSTVKIRFYASTGQGKEGWVIENFALTDADYATFRLEAEDADLQTEGVIAYAGGNWSTPATTDTDSDGADQGTDGTVRRNSNGNNTDTVTVKFYGSGIGVTYRLCNGCGQFDWDLDSGTYTGTVDTSNASTVYQVTTMLKSGLSYTSHTLIITSKGSGNEFFLDGFDVERPSQYFRKFWELGKPGPATYYSFGPDDDNTAGDYGYAFGTLIDHNYLSNVEYSLESPTIDLSAVSTPIMLTWYQQGEYFEGMDGVLVDYSTNSGTTWTQLSTSSVEYDVQLPTGRENPLETLWAYTFNDSGWDQKVADISTLSGIATSRIRFRFGSGFGIDSTKDAADELAVAPGVYIDDVTIARGGGDNILEAIEVYNLSTQDLDLNNWTLETSTGSDTISNGCADCSATTTLPSGAYAIIVDSDSWFYKDCPAGSIGYNCLFSGTDGTDYIKLSLSGSGSTAFGGSGLKNLYDQLTLKNSDGDLIDYVGYNLIFQDDLDSTDANYWKTNYSRTTQDPRGARANNCNSDENGGDENIFTWGTPGFGPAADHTSGSGQAWGVNMGTGRICKDAGGSIVMPTLDLTNAASATLYFWQWLDTFKNPKWDSGNNDYKDIRDGYMIEVSTVGGSPDDTAGQWTQIDDAVTPNPNPFYDGGVDKDHAGGGYLNAKNVYGKDAKFWRRIKVDLSAYAGSVIRLRFYYESTTKDDKNDGNCNAPWLPNTDIVDEKCPYVRGLYLDDFLVTAGWGGVEGSSIERRCPRGYSNSPVNWGASTDPDGLTPTEINSLTITAGCGS